MKKTIFLIFICTTLHAYAQNLTCDDFNEGTFYGSTPQLPGVEWKIIRTEKNQIETLSKIPKEYIDMGLPTDTLYAKFEKLDKKCTYRFIYDETRMTLDDYQIQMNNSGGILVEIEKIEGNCFFYISHALIENKEISFEGKICKE